VTEPPRTLQSLLTPGSEAERPRETPSLLDELHGIQELLDRPASRETLLAQVFEFALEAARDHHRQQVAEHAFELDERRRRAQQDACQRWLRIAVAYALGVLVIVAVAVAVVSVIAGRINPLELLPPRP
jgi:hypothetical protein